jgi:hypothetical protein
MKSKLEKKGKKNNHSKKYDYELKNTYENFKEKQNSTTSNEKRESQCLSSISVESKNQPRKKETNVQSKKDLNNLDNNKIKVITQDVAKKVLQHLNEYVDSIKNRNSTASNEKRESQCLSSISAKSKNQPRKEEKNVQSKKDLNNLEDNKIEAITLEEYGDNKIKEPNSTTSNKKRKMRGLPSISINSECQPRKKGKNDSESPIKVITLKEYDDNKIKNQTQLPRMKKNRK